VKQFFTKAENTTESHNFILSDVISKSSQATIGKVPSVSCMKRTMRNIRFRKNEGPILPIHRNDIKFPENFTNLPNGEEFLYFDLGHKGHRILIF